MRKLLDKFHKQISNKGKKKRRKKSRPGKVSYYLILIILMKEAQDS